MRKPDLTKIYVLLIDALVTAIIMNAITRIFESPHFGFLLIITIVLFIVCFVVVDILWMPVARKIIKIKRGFNIWRSKPDIEYSFQQREDKVYLRIKSSPKNKKLMLRLDFNTPETTGLIDEQTRYQIQLRFVNVHRKNIYFNQDFLPDALIELPDPVVRLGDDYLALIVNGWDIPIPLDRYIYQFTDEGTHKGVSFGNEHRFAIEVKEGRFTYEEKL